MINTNQLIYIYSLKNSLIANPDCIALEANWEKIIKSLNVNSSNKTLNLYKRLNKLRKVLIFKNLSEQKIISLSKLMKKERFGNGDCIVREKTEGEKFYFISKGKVKIMCDNKLIREMEKGSYFGEISLLNKENRTASVIASEETLCYSLSKNDFLSIIDSQILETLKARICLQDTNIQLKDLKYIKFLGKGKFGNVSLVHNGKYLYAIKAVSRKAAEKQKILAKYFVAEKKIMLTLDHPFIIKFVKSLKNEDFCFFLLEFINGKNLDEYLTERKYLRSTSETKFFMASLLLIIDYLHKKNISHRDLKPSNIMIEKTGYLKMIDFGTSKSINDFTQTVIGTPHYIAPEIIIGKGYSLTCDYWSLGICMYEIFYGSCPFGNSANDILEVYKEILHQ
jgi:cGMP-dependent protein kinase